MSVGIIGCGAMAEIHLAIYKKLENGEVIAISDINREKAKKIADKWKIKRAYTDHRDLLETKDLDVVDICTPTSTHASIAIDVAKSGCNILLEKPMGVTSKECDRMIEESRKRSVSLCINHHTLFLPSIRKSKSLVDTGYFDLQSFEVSLCRNLKIERIQDWALKPENGGLIWEVGTHLAYLELFFLPNIRDVYAVGHKTDHVYDNFIVLLSSPDSRFGLFKCCLTSNQKEYSCRITSKNGNRAEINLLLDSFIDQSKYTSKPYTRFYHEQKSLLRSWIKSFGRAMYHHIKDYGFYPDIFSKFVLMKSCLESIKKGTPPPVTPEEGKNTIKLLECIKESLDSGRVVSFQ